MTQSDARNRLAQLSKTRGASLASLSELLGRNASYLQQFIKKGSPRKLEEGDRKTLAEFFGVHESELGAPEDDAKEKSYNASQSYIRSAKLADWVDVPRLDIGAAAGPGSLPTSEAAFDSFQFSRRWLLEQGLERAQLCAITVEGDSMEPLLNDGDEILIDTAPRSFRDGVHVVRLGDTLKVKRVAQAGAGRFSLLSQNLAYPPVEVASDEIQVIGRVVWKSGRI